MSNFKMVAPYCAVSRYDKNFFVYYLNTDENLRREYVFNTDEDANNFSKALENLTVFMKDIPVRKKEVYHQAFLDLLLKEVDHKLSIRTKSRWVRCNRIGNPISTVISNRTKAILKEQKEEARPLLSGCASSCAEKWAVDTCSKMSFFTGQSTTKG